MKKTLFITGSTDGIGKLAAIKLAEAGHTVCLHGRNADKLAATVAEVKKHSKTGEVQGFVADLADLHAVSQLAQQLKHALPSLDVLINNAGIFKSPLAMTPDGLDIRFVVNYLAPYLLTQELLPLLRKGSHPRIIQLGSAAQAPVSIAALLGKARLPEMEAYAQSKLALTAWSFHLAKIQPGIDVIVLNPGSLLNTKMVREAFGKHWAPAEKGADILYELATSHVYNGVTGQYFDNDKGDFGPAHAQAYDERKTAELLAATKGLLESLKK